MIGKFKNAFAALLDEGYSVEDVKDMIDAAKVEYDRAHHRMIVEEIADEIICIFSDYGYNIPDEAIQKFVDQSINVVSCTEEKCAEPTKCLCEEKNVAEKKLPNGGYVKVKINDGNADEVLAMWMKQIGLR